MRLAPRRRRKDCSDESWHVVAVKGYATADWFGLQFESVPKGVPDGSPAINHENASGEDAVKSIAVDQDSGGRELRGFSHR